ncbi:MAG: hypothetical protein AAFZ52_04285 [Bacteroidota bacterium]
MLSILSFSTNLEILPVMDRLVNKNPEWEGRRAADLATAIDLVKATDYDFVLLGAGTGAADRTALQAEITAAGKHTRLIDHYGGGSGLLLAEIQEAVAKNPPV